MSIPKLGRSYGHGVTLEYRKGRQNYQSGKAAHWHVLVHGRSVYESVYYERAEERAEREAESRRNIGREIDAAAKRRHYDWQD